MGANGADGDRPVTSPATTTPASTQPQMAVAGDRLRLAVGIFYEPPSLSRAMAELFAEGVDAQDMCLVGMPPAFAAARARSRRMESRGIPMQGRI
jgi:hypothetical protein